MTHSADDLPRAAVDCLADVDARAALGEYAAAAALIEQWLEACPDADRAERQQLAATAAELYLHDHQPQLARPHLAQLRGDGVVPEATVALLSARLALQLGDLAAVAAQLPTLGEQPAAQLVRIEYAAAAGQWTEAVTAANALLVQLDQLDLTASEENWEDSTDDVAVLTLMHRLYGERGDHCGQEAIANRLTEIAPHAL